MPLRHGGAVFVDSFLPLFDDALRRVAFEVGQQPTEAEIGVGGEGEVHLERSRQWVCVGLPQTQLCEVVPYVDAVLHCQNG